MPDRIRRREFLAAIGGMMTGLVTAVPGHTLAMLRRPCQSSHLSPTNTQEAPGRRGNIRSLRSPFRLAVINDEIAQDFGHACEIASHDFGMEWIELRSMWDKNLLDLDSTEVKEVSRILEKYELRVTDIASPLFKVDWPGAPKSKFSPAHDQFHAGFSFDQQNQVLERAIELARTFHTDRVRCFDFWRLDDQRPHRAAINERLREAAEKSSKQGVTLVLENEPACNTATGAESAQVLNAVKSPFLMLNWDPANAAASGETPFPDGYKLLPKNRIGHCHCKDVTKRGRKYDWAAMGQGMVDWVGQFGALKRDGYHWGVSLETHWDGAGTPEKSSRQSWTGMTALLRKARAL
jgi:L-ribulose-5-phosphate 3-epimerase